MTQLNTYMETHFLLTRAGDTIQKSGWRSTGLFCFFKTSSGSNAGFLQAIRFTPQPIFLGRESDPNETLRLKLIFKMNWRHGGENLSSKLISLKSPSSYLEVKNGSEFGESGGEGLPATLGKENYEWNVTSKCREVIHFRALWQPKLVCVCVCVSG